MAARCGTVTGIDWRFESEIGDAGDLREGARLHVVTVTVSMGTGC